MCRIQNFKDGEGNCPPTHELAAIGEDLQSIHELESQCCEFNHNSTINSILRVHETLHDK